jgi:hypothetical protein
MFLGYRIWKSVMQDVIYDVSSEMTVDVHWSFFWTHRVGQSVLEIFFSIQLLMPFDRAPQGEVAFDLVHYPGRRFAEFYRDSSKSRNETEDPEAAR